MHKICFVISFISCLYMFRAHVLITKRSKLHYTAFGIIAPIGGRLVHETARSAKSQNLWRSSFQSHQVLDFKALVFYFIERPVLFGQCLMISKVFVILMCFAHLFFCIVLNFILYLTMMIFLSFGLFWFRVYFWPEKIVFCSVHYLNSIARRISNSSNLSVAVLTQDLQRYKSVQQKVIRNSAWNSLFILISSSGYNFKTVTYNCWMFW